MISGSQIRAARGLLNMSVSELAELSGLAVNTIRRAEGTNEPPPITQANINLLESVFDEAGVLFIDGDGFGPGVRFRSVRLGAAKSRRRS